MKQNREPQTTPLPEGQEFSVGWRYWSEASGGFLRNASEHMSIYTNADDKILQAQHLANLIATCKRVGLEVTDEMIEAVRNRYGV